MNIRQTFQDFFFHKSTFLRGIIIGKSKHLRNSSDIFSTLSSRYLWCPLQCKIPVEFLFIVYWNLKRYSCVLKQKILNFIILVDIYCSGTKVFKIIAIVSKKKWRQKLGTDYSILWLLRDKHANQSRRIFYRPSGNNQFHLQKYILVENLRGELQRKLTA